MMNKPKPQSGPDLETKLSNIEKVRIFLLFSFDFIGKIADFQLR